MGLLKGLSLGKKVNGSTITQRGTPTFLKIRGGKKPPNFYPFPGWAGRRVVTPLPAPRPGSFPSETQREVGELRSKSRPKPRTSRGRWLRSLISGSCVAEGRGFSPGDRKWGFPLGNLFGFLLLKARSGSSLPDPAQFGGIAAPPAPCVSDSQALSSGSRGRGV